MLHAPTLSRFLRAAYTVISFPHTCSIVYYNHPTPLSALCARALTLRVHVPGLRATSHIARHLHTHTTCTLLHFAPSLVECSNAAAHAPVLLVLRHIMWFTAYTLPHPALGALRLSTYTTRVPGLRATSHNDCKTLHTRVQQQCCTRAPVLLVLSTCRSLFLAAG